MIGILALLVIPVLYIKKEREEVLRKKRMKRCDKCGDTLSEWFKDGDGFMTCYTCGKKSPYKWHGPV